MWRHGLRTFWWSQYVTAAALRAAAFMTNRRRVRTMECRHEQHAGECECQCIGCYDHLHECVHTADQRSVCDAGTSASERHRHTEAAAATFDLWCVGLVNDPLHACIATGKPLFVMCHKATPVTTRSIDTVPAQMDHATTFIKSVNPVRSRVRACNDHIAPPVHSPRRRGDGAWLCPGMAEHGVPHLPTRCLGERVEPASRPHLGLI